MNKISETILSNSCKEKKMLAVLLDPEKCREKMLVSVLSAFEKNLPDFIFVGGSSKSCPTDDLFDALHDVPVPKILFPGDTSQFSPEADALLFLSLISGRNPDYLIGQHVLSALEIKQSGIETIPTGYILIDGGNHSAVQRVSQTIPIPAHSVDECVSTAVAGELLGMKMIYLEAGSGAENPVSADIIAAVKRNLNIPLLVGGGIRTTGQLTSALSAGADLIVVGNVFESQTDKIAEFIHCVKSH